MSPEIANSIARVLYRFLETDKDPEVLKAAEPFLVEFIAEEALVTDARQARLFIQDGEEDGAGPYRLAIFNCPHEISVLADWRAFLQPGETWDQTAEYFFASGLINFLGAHAQASGCRCGDPELARLTRLETALASRLSILPAGPGEEHRWREVTLLREVGRGT